jgi:hypothetical protein
MPDKDLSISGIIFRTSLFSKQKKTRKEKKAFPKNIYFFYLEAQLIQKLKQKKALLFKFTNQKNKNFSDSPNFNYKKRKQQHKNVFKTIFSPLFFEIILFLTFKEYFY